MLRWTLAEVFGPSGIAQRCILRRAQDPDRGTSRRLGPRLPDTVIDHHKLRCAVFDQGLLLFWAELVVNRHHHAAPEKHAGGCHQPQRLIFGQDRDAAARLKTLILQRGGDPLRMSLHVETAP